MKPDWRGAPDWAQWLAQDESGDWLWYASKPVMTSFPEGGGWSPPRGLPHPEAWNRLAGCGELNPNWRDTLERRPPTRQSEVSADDADNMLTPLQQQVDQLAHEPSRDELEDMHDPEGEPWCWPPASGRTEIHGPSIPEMLERGARGLNEDLKLAEEHYSDDPVNELGHENIQLSEGLAHALDDLEQVRKERDTAWKELREIRKAIKANPEESTADEVRRLVAESNRRLFDAVLRETVHPRARCPVCIDMTPKWAALCSSCSGTGRRHINRKPFYDPEEVAEFARTAREERDTPQHDETHCGFPGEMNKP